MKLKKNYFPKLLSMRLRGKNIEYADSNPNVSLAILRNYIYKHELSCMLLFIHLVELFNLINIHYLLYDNISCYRFNHCSNKLYI